VTLIHNTGAGSLGAPRAVHYRDKLTNYVIGAESAAEAETESAIRQDILVREGEVEEGSLFVDEMPIEMPIANVCPCVQRRTLSRDESIVLESQIFSWQVYEVIIRISISLTISP
jgi:hypothetical protein